MPPLCCGSLGLKEGPGGAARGFAEAGLWDIARAVVATKPNLSTARLSEGRKLSASGHFGCFGRSEMGWSAFAFGSGLPNGSSRRGNGR